jgi:DMSO/TMAO reductase YedYZ molybdopterin-dependent catalytic subunit
MTKPSAPDKPPGDEEMESSRTLARMTRRGFAWGGAACLAGVAGWKWVTSRTPEGMTPWPLRRVLEFDEKVGRAVFRSDRLAPTFAASRVSMPRVNGSAGVDLNLDLDHWRLQVQGPAGSKSFSLADVRALPRFEMSTELKCIEGWSTVVSWAGARLSDLAELTGLATRGGQPGKLGVDSADLLRFAALATPNAKYYVGLDMASALHPQTLLCYEMNGLPLTKYHGAPLRLAIPVKYGIKSLKQIGTLRFTDTQPTDYWAERGYDWYSGH